MNSGGERIADAATTIGSLEPVAIPPASAPPAPPAAVPQAPTSFWQRLPGVPMALTFVFASFVFLPRVWANPNLVRSYSALAAAFFVWELVLWATARRSGRAFRIEYFPVKSHWVQACVQFSIMLYWGWFWPNVYPELPLIFTEIVYLYILDAMLSWSRGRTWRLGFGPLPIVVSTNLLLWFKDDWYVMQFLMLTTGALAKQFITWNRDGRRTHIFNPSAFGQFIFAIGLIATDTTKDLTWGKEIAASFDTPHMLVVIFLGGLVVQYLFHVTLMTVAATATLCLVNLVYTKVTGTYFFVNINVAAPIFLGLHLLITDPATSPRTNIGKVFFGVAYALSYCALFRILDIYEVPIFWDKLLPVPILNLCVPLIDRVTRTGIIGRVNRLWESALRPARLNLAHMACWAALFITMAATGFIEAHHPGDSIPFWKQAYADGKPHAGHSLVMAAGAQAIAGQSGAAYNELGLICIEGKIVHENHATAARYFATGCELGNLNSCANTAILYLFLGEYRSPDDVRLAFDRLEAECASEPDWGVCYLLGRAYETGRGRPRDKAQAADLYERCGRGNIYGCKGRARISLSGAIEPRNLLEVAQVLTWSAKRGDSESCWYLAYMNLLGLGVPRNELRAKLIMGKACEMGSQQACDAANQPELPPYSNPIMVVPGWSTAFPLPPKPTTAPAEPGSTPATAPAAEAAASSTPPSQ